MVQLITTSDWDNVSLSLKNANPDWILLDKEKVKSLLEDAQKEEDGKYYSKHFILPYELVNRRYASTKTRVMVIYLLVRSRKRAQTFTIIAPSKDRVDLRLQRMIDGETKWV